MEGLTGTCAALVVVALAIYSLGQVHQFNMVYDMGLTIDYIGRT
jgi:hypothetical protein